MTDPAPARDLLVTALRESGAMFAEVIAALVEKNDSGRILLARADEATVLRAEVAVLTDVAEAWHRDHHSDTLLAECIEPRCRRAALAAPEPAAVERKHEHHDPDNRVYDFWCIAPCHDGGMCDGECHPDCETCPMPCPLCAPEPAAACARCGWPGEMADDDVEGLAGCKHPKPAAAPTPCAFDGCGRRPEHPYHSPCPNAHDANAVCHAYQPAPAAAPTPEDAA